MVRPLALPKPKGKPLVQARPKEEPVKPVPKTMSAMGTRDIPVPVEPVWPKPLGKTDERFPECVLVPIEKAPAVYPKIYKALCPPNTFFRVVKETGRPRSLVTVMPDGLRVAHANCGSFSALDINQCRCSRGLSACRSIEYIYDKTIASLANEEWGIHHPNYLGSFRRVEREIRASRSPVMPEREITRQIITVTSKSVQPLVPKSQKVEVNDNMDLESLGAGDMAKTLTKKLLATQKQVEEDEYPLIIGVTIDPSFDPYSPIPSKRKPLVLPSKKK